MKKWEILKKVGNIEQLAYVRPIIYQDGKAKGMKAIEIKSGDIRFVVSPDKCMDIINLSYKGTDISFLSKSGLQGREEYTAQGGEDLRSIMGGMLFTCGPDNVGPSEGNEGKQLVLHGRMRLLPATHVNYDAFWREDQYCIEVSGEMRLAQLFGENIVLRRKIEMILGEHKIRLHDEWENQGFSAQPLMLLYHFNIGYPLLDAGSGVCIPSKQVCWRDNDCKIDNEWKIITEPVDELPEEVIYHYFEEDITKVIAKIENMRQGIGFQVTFDKRQLPYLTQWKSMRSGDYVLGLEPCNCHAKGRSWEEKNGTLEMIMPMEKKNIDLEIDILSNF